MIEDNIVRVGRDEAMQHLKSKLNGYRRSGRLIYIGITANPENRWETHLRNGGDWKKMVLLYEAYSLDIAITLERDLIDYAHRCNFQLAPVNIGPGGEGSRGEPGPRYLYVLVGS